MISIHCSLLIIVLLHAAASRVIEPSKADYEDEDDSTVYEPEEDKSSLGLLMQMSYNNSIPISALIACEKEQAAACPSPSEDGSHPCIALNDICDHRPQCPGGEDETPVICFFHEMHARELARLRKHAIDLYREVSHHSPRSHGN